MNKGGDNMSHWTYVQGSIDVTVMGRTQAEKTYILQTILDHLPKVTGSEENMNIYINQKNGYMSSQNCDEFGNCSNLLNGGLYGHNLEMQDWYLITVDGSLRDRELSETVKEFMNWLCRFSKRCLVDSVLVRVSSYEKSIVIDSDKCGRYFSELYEYPTWTIGNETGEPSWAEYLMWKPYREHDMPALLAYKYYEDEDNDKKVEDWYGGYLDKKGRK